MIDSPFAQRQRESLDDEGRSLWDYLSGQVEVGPLDVPAFALLCQAWSNMQAAAAELKSVGVTAIGAQWLPGSGDDELATGRTVKKHPAAQVWRDNESTFRALCDRFGLNPKARSSTKPTPVEDDAGGLLDS